MAWEGVDVKVRSQINNLFVCQHALTKIVVSKKITKAWSSSQFMAKVIVASDTYRNDLIVFEVWRFKQIQKGSL